MNKQQQAVTAKVLIAIQRELVRLREIVEEPYLEVTDDVVAAVEHSRRKPRSSFISHEKLEQEFLDR